MSETQADDLSRVAKYEGLTVSDMIAIATEEKLSQYDLKELRKLYG